MTSLLVTSKGTHIPLKSQIVYLTAKNQNANFIIMQEYSNNESLPIEAFFTFPVPTESCVYFFQAILDDGTIIDCKIKEKNEAKKYYNKAINTGDTAYYMEQQTDDIFSIAIGNLAPKTNIKICFKYALELKNEINHLNLRVIFPLTLMPRYTPINTNADLQNPKKISEKPFYFSISGDIMMSDGIKSIESKTHRIRISNMKENRLHFNIDDLDKLDQDIVITIERKNSESYAIVQKFVGTLQDQMYRYCTAINIVPDFDKLPEIDVRNIHYTLLLDNSGSMEGYNIDLCKKAAQQFVALLPVESTFDIYIFNSIFDKFKCSSKSLNDINEKKKEAATWIQNISAHGGTIILPVLTDIYSEYEKIDKTGIMIVISDGGVSNTSSVLQLVKRNKNVKIFTLGIGCNVSQELIQGMATQSNGHAEFIGSGDSNIIEKVRSQLRKSQDTLHKNQSDYKISINGTGDKMIIIPEISDDNNPILYSQTNNIFYMFSEFEPISVTYSEKINNHMVDKIIMCNKWSFSKTTIESDDPIIDDPIIDDPIIEYQDSEQIIHRIAGNKLIAQINANYYLQDQAPDKMFKEIIMISTDLNIISKYTSFIGIEYKKNKILGTLQQRIIPLQEPKSIYESAISCGSMVECSRGRSGGIGSGVIGSAMRGGSGVIGSAIRGYIGSNTGLESLKYADIADKSVVFSKSKSASDKLPIIEMIGKFITNLFKKSESNNVPDNHAKVNSPVIENLVIREPIISAKNPPKNNIYAVCVRLTEQYISLSGNILTCVNNRNLIQTIQKLSSNLNDNNLTDLKVKDLIELTMEEDNSINGIYEIISLGSDREPWVLCKNDA